MKEKEMIQEVQPKKLNKKGFSLVELIVVIAIMAILVGIVGMAVLPQIENAREGKDMQVLSGLCTSATTAFASNAAALETGIDYNIILASTDPAASTLGKNGDKVLADIKELQNNTTGSLFNKLKGDMESKKVKDSASGCNSIKIHYAGASTGIVTVTAYKGNAGNGDVILEAVSSK